MRRKQSPQQQPHAGSDMGSEHHPQNRNRAEAPQGFRFPTPRNSETTDHSPDMEKLYGILELAFTPSFVPWEQKEN